MSASTLPTNLPTDRDLRMVLTLLNSTDPCGWRREGRGSDPYAEAAAEVIAQLARGGGEVEVLLTLPEAEVEIAHQFARVAVHWWANRLTLLGGA